MRHKLNKKADENIMSLWWFFIIVIVSAAIVGGILMYYGADIDTRNMEARILFNRLSECLSNGANINEKIFEDSFDIFSECNINKELFGEESKYYMRIGVKDVLGNTMAAEKHYGLRIDEKNCIITRNGNLYAERFSKCYFGKIRLINKEGKSVFLEIISSSDQKGRTNIKLS